MHRDKYGLFFLSALLLVGSALSFSSPSHGDVWR